jgi:hypothetical protein
MDEVARRMGVLASRGDLTTFEQAKLAELQAQYDALQEQYQENALVHQQATRQILFDLIAQQAAIDGIDQAELAMLTALAEGWNLIDDATANATASIMEAMAYFAETGDMEGFLAMIDAIILAMDPLLPGSPPPLAKGLKAITKQMGGLIQSYDKFSGILADGTLSAGFTTSMNAPSVAPSYSAAPNYFEGNKTVNVNMGGISMNEGMNATQLEALIIRTVKKGIRHEQ